MFQMIEPPLKPTGQLSPPNQAEKTRAATIKAQRRGRGCLYKASTPGIGIGLGLTTVPVGPAGPSILPARVVIGVDLG